MAGGFSFPILFCTEVSEVIEEGYYNCTKLTMQSLKQPKCSADFITEKLVQVLLRADLSSLDL